MGKLSNFLQEIKYYKNEDIYFALEEFIRLRPINKKEYTSPSIKHVLSYLNKELIHRIKRINNQIKYQYRLDYESLAESAVCISLGTTFNVLIYYCLKNEGCFKYNEASPFIAVLSVILGPLFSIISITHLQNALNPNRENEHLEKYKNLFNFVKQLQTHEYPHDAWFFF